MNAPDHVYSEVVRQVEAEKKKERLEAMRAKYRSRARR
jgi:hypothetical protein